MTEQAIRRRIRNLIESNYSDLYITKSILTEFGLQPIDTESRIREMRATTVDLSKVEPEFDKLYIENDDERRFDADLGHALGKDWGSDD